SPVRMPARSCCRSVVARSVSSWHPPMCLQDSERVAVGLAGANAQRVLERRDEHLAVTDLSGARRGAERLDDAFRLVGRDRDLDADFRQEVHDVFGAAINLGMALLAAITFDLGHRHAADAETVERLAHLVELERLDDRDDELHDRLPLWAPVASNRG